MAVIAGTSPNTQTLNAARSAVKPSTRTSAPAYSPRKSDSRSCASSRSDPQKDSRRPAAAPAPASTRLSVNNCRTSRARDAPTAARMLISSERPAPRASIRLATFAHAMTRTRPVTVRRSAASGKSSPRSAGDSPDEARETTAVRPLFVSGYVCSSLAAMAVTAAPACCAVVPGSRRPITRSHNVPRSSSHLACAVLMAGSAAIGSQISAACPSSGPVKPSAATPDDGERPSIDDERLPHHIRRAAETLVPQPMPENCGRLGSGAVVGRLQQAAGGGKRAERREIRSASRGGRGVAPAHRRFPG